MENNNERGNNRGVFYVVMGVATLVISLIGATFAYFVATTNSATNAISANTTSVSLAFDDNTANPVEAVTGTAHVTKGADGSALTTGIKSLLIPVDTVCTADDVTADASLASDKQNCPSAGTSVAFAQKGYTGMNVAGTESVTYDYAGEGTDDCRDANGNFICSVYQFTVTNPTGNPSQTVYPTFKVTNLGAKLASLKYAVFKGTAAQVAASSKGWDVNGSPVTTAQTEFTTANLQANGGVSFLKTTSTTVTRKMAVANPGDLVIAATSITANLEEKGTLGGTNGWSRLVQILDADESMTYTMIVWLEEDYTNQSDEMKMEFAAQVSFTTEGNNTGVTGSLVM